MDFDRWFDWFGFVTARRDEADAHQDAYVRMRDVLMGSASLQQKKLAWNELCRLAAPQLAAHVRSRVPGLADDVVQNAWLAAISARPNLYEFKTWRQFRAYLLEVVRNGVGQAVRVERRASLLPIVRWKKDDRGQAPEVLEKWRSSASADAPPAGASEALGHEIRRATELGRDVAFTRFATGAQRPSPDVPPSYDAEVGIESESESAPSDEMLHQARILDVLGPDHEGPKSNAGHQNASRERTHRDERRAALDVDDQVDLLCFRNKLPKATALTVADNAWLISRFLARTRIRLQQSELLLFASRLRGHEHPIREVHDAIRSDATRCEWFLDHWYESPSCSESSTAARFVSELLAKPETDLFSLFEQFVRYWLRPTSPRKSLQPWEALDDVRFALRGDLRLFLQFVEYWTSAWPLAPARA